MTGFKEGSKINTAHGHRARLRRRFSKSGADALPDYELLELVLFRAIPRKDTKPISKALLKRFGSFSDVIYADPDHLKEIKGVGDSVVTELKLIKAASIRLLQNNIKKRPALDNWAELVAYCQAAMASEPKEQFRLICLNKRNEIISDEIQQQGTVDHTPVYVREIAKRALVLSATAIILVHNHPSGDPTPSKADIQLTREIVKAMEKLSIIVHDHIIVGRYGYASFRELKLI